MEDSHNKRLLLSGIFATSLPRNCFFRDFAISPPGVLKAYVNDFFCPPAIGVGKFMLSPLPTYYIPEDLSLQAYVAYIKDWPQAESPEAFGQHVNAEISSALQESEDTLQTLLSMQGATTASASGGKSKDQQVFELTQSLLEMLPEAINWRDVEERNKSDNSPYKVGPLLHVAVCLWSTILHNGLCVQGE